MLCFVDDSMPGITRKRRGRYWMYFDADGNRITDRDEIDRLNSVGLPPAYGNAWYCPSPDGHIQAIGYDARGRKQYRYHPSFRSQREAAKYESCASFGRALPKVRAKVATDLGKQPLSQEAVIAAVVRLLDREHLRVGNEAYARENKSFGATTLRDRHARVFARKVRMRFKGKHGVVHELNITDRRLLRVVRNCQDLPGQNLFQYLDEDDVPVPVTSNDVNDYIREAIGEAFPHLGRERDRVRATARRRRTGNFGETAARAGLASSRQYAGDHPQILCPSGADRRRESGSAQSAWWIALPTCYAISQQH
jgi:DNA topoisomerase-1